MAAKLSAGILLYRTRAGVGTEVLLAHMGGPLWRNKDQGAWSIPKGEYAEPEAPLQAALREFQEELGSAAPAGPFLDLGEARQPGGKIVRVWAAEGELNTATVVSNTFELEWPRGSGNMRQFPEIDRAEWFTFDAARAKLLKGQLPFLDRLSVLLGP